VIASWVLAVQRARERSIGIIGDCSTDSNYDNKIAAEHTDEWGDSRRKSPLGYNVAGTKHGVRG
jgi:hypothetical protein